MCRIIITFILLLIAISSYVGLNKYASTDPADTEDTIISKTKNSTVSDKDAIKLATEKYYMAVAMLTDTKTDIDKIYNKLDTVDVIITDQNLIDKLNNQGGKTYALNSSASIVRNYDEVIASNFTKEFIDTNIVVPNGFIAVVDNEHYVIKDKIENNFFKEVKISLLSKKENSLHFQAVVTKYGTNCVLPGTTVPSITCKNLLKTNPLDFNLVKEDGKWKIETMTLIN